MPVGIPKKEYEEYGGFFGFGLYKIITPKNMKIPFLPYRSLNSYGIPNLICPLGGWAGWYFSEEIKYARNLGYTCTFVTGYSFNKSKSLFYNYITSLYKMKANATNPVQRMIVKLLLNSLYGRWGLNLTFNNHIITSASTKIKDIRAKYNIISENELVIGNVSFFHLVYTFEPNSNLLTTNPKLYKE
jgi:hypothetical protein